MTQGLSRASCNTALPPEMKPEKVRRLFDDVAHRYDFLNSLLSFGLDRSWRRQAVRLSAAKQGQTVLDLCAGTGKFAIDFAREGCRVVAVDFSLRMLTYARRLTRGKRLDITFVAGDVMRLPIREKFDVVSIAFGLRNLDNPEQGLRMMRALLRPGGRAVVLELIRPEGRLSGLCRMYIESVVPAVGRLISLDKFAYRYLADSIVNFWSPGELAQSLKRAGMRAFVRVCRPPVVAIGIGRV